MDHVSSLRIKSLIDKGDSAAVEKAYKDDDYIERRTGDLLAAYERAVAEGAGKAPVSLVVDLVFEVWTEQMRLSVERARRVALEKRIDELEKRVENVKGLEYCGVWGVGAEYTRNELVTFAGSLWICLEKTTARPGTSEAWQLCVKKGKDAR